MTAPDLRKLAMAAKEAWQPNEWFTPDTLASIMPLLLRRDAAYIAAASPDVLLRLLAEIDSWHAEIKSVREFAKAILHGGAVHQAWLLEAAEAFISGQPLPPPRQDNFTDITAERDRLREALRQITQFKGQFDLVKDGNLQTAVQIAIEALEERT